MTPKFLEIAGLLIRVDAIVSIGLEHYGTEIDDIGNGTERLPVWYVVAWTAEGERALLSKGTTRKKEAQAELDTLPDRLRAAGVDVVRL